jgi:hypothetical protein
MGGIIIHLQMNGLSSILFAVAFYMVHPVHTMLLEWLPAVDLNIFHNEVTFCEVDGL